MGRSTIASTVVLGLTICAGVALAQRPAPRAEDYSWAESCRGCHEQIYDAWSKTKHATALDRLSSTDQEKPCLACHVTGPVTRITDGKKVANRGVQCESCHGAAAAHAADPAVRTGLVKAPDASRCEDCHNDKGPHFKGFWYDAMRGLSHRVK